MVSKEKTFFSFIWVLIERFSFSALRFGSTLVLARLLSPYEFGLIGTVTIFVSLSNKLVEAGFGSALVQKKEVTNQEYSTVFVFNAIMSLFIYGVLFFSAPYIAEFYDNEIFTNIIRWLGLMLLLNAVTLTQRVHLIRNLAFKTQTKIKLVALSISIVVALLLAYFGFGVWALVMQLVLNSFLVSLLMWAEVRFMPKLIFHTAILKRLFDFGGKIVMTSALQTIYEDIFGLIITKKFSVGLTGFYSQSKKLVSFPTGIFSSLYESAAFPILSKIKKPKEFKRVVSNINKGIFSIALPLLLVVPFQSENIILVMLGEKWRESSEILSILSLSLIISLISLSSYNILKSLGKGKEMLQYGVIKIIIGGIVLIITVQISFQAIMYGIVFTDFIFSLIIFHKISKITLYKWVDIFKDYFLLLFPLLIINIISKYIISFVNIENIIINLLSYLMLVFVLTSGYFLLFKKDTIRSILTIIKKRKE